MRPRAQRPYGITPARKASGALGWWRAGGKAKSRCLLYPRVSYNHHASSGTYTDCYNTAAPLEFPNGIKQPRPKMGLGNPSSAIQADHAHMPFQDDNHSCAPLALYSLHRKAGGLALAMEAKKASEVSADLRVIQAAVSAQLISSHVGGKLLSAL